MSDYVQRAHGVFSLTLLDPETCQSIVSRLQESEAWSAATVGSQSESGEVLSIADDEFRSASVLFPEDAPSLFTKIDARLDEVIGPLAKHIWGVDLAQREGTQIVRYRAGGHYDAHADAALDLQQRYFTVLCYLNDDFAGGQTSFPYLGDLAVEPVAGRVVLFPSRYVHRAESVLSGEKYVAVTWLHGPTSTKWI